MNKRRKLLLALSVSSAATVWKKPVVDAVTLPAHATTSCTLPLDCRSSERGSFRIELVGSSYILWHYTTSDCTGDNGHSDGEVHIANSPDEIECDDRYTFPELFVHFNEENTYPDICVDAYVCHGH